MSSLNPKHFEKLVSSLAVILRATNFNAPHFPFESGIEKVRDLKEIWPKPHFQSLTEFLSDDPLYDFFFEWLLTEYWRKKDALSKEQVAGAVGSPLFEPDELAKQMIEAVLGFPTKYTLLLPLPSARFDQFEVSLALSEDFRVVLETDESLSSFAIPTVVDESEESMISKAYQGLYDKSLTPRYAVVVSFVGVVRAITDSRSIENAVSDLKAFLGAAVAIDLFSAPNSTFSSVRKFQSRKLYFFEEQSSDGKPVRTSNLNPFESDLIGGLKLARPSVERPAQLAEGLGLFIDPKLSPYYDFRNWTQASVSALHKLFEQGEDARRLRRACHWFFDSMCAPTELLSYIQGTTVLEIILGERERNNRRNELGTTSLLKNRYAYLLGRNAAERKSLQEDLERIYRTRCDIVHEGKNYLSGEERLDLFRLKRACKSVIRKEMSCGLD